MATTRPEQSVLMAEKATRHGANATQDLPVKPYTRLALPNVVTVAAR
jgi:hypothetical protein